MRVKRGLGGMHARDPATMVGRRQLKVIESVQPLQGRGDPNDSMHQWQPKSDNSLSQGSLRPA